VFLLDQQTQVVSALTRLQWDIEEVLAQGGQTRGTG
jgi:hypothetical protein